MLVHTVFAIAMQVWATGDPTRASGISTTDSLRIVRAARSAQSSFEAFRRARLPIGYGISGPCDVYIGRYCYWRGDESDETQPPEALEIVRRRDDLIRALDSAARVLSNDVWIAGQHVRYLVEAGRTDDAIRFTATDCHAGAAWCNALRGYAAHVGGRFATADSAFTTALAEMPKDERCRWMDISNLLDDDLERRFRSADCAGREALAERLFWFGAPLYSVGRTDLRTEHFARLTRARIAEDAASIDGQSWAPDQRELVVRYGWPRWYSRSTSSVAMDARPSFTGHDAGTPYNFLPSIRAVDSVAQTGSSDWRLADRRSRTGYTPSYARTMHDLPSQVALFRRGDSVLAVAAWDARRDTTMLGRDLDAALVLASPDGKEAVTRLSAAKTTGRIAVTGLIDSGLVSLELLAREDRRAARARSGIHRRSDGRVALSDLLLYKPDSTPPYELGAVQDATLASDILPASRAIGVYWETYGLHTTGEPVRFTLTVERVDVSWIRHIAERLRFADPTSSLRVQWEEVPQQRGGIAGRGVRVDLSLLRGGRYRVELNVAATGGATAISSREIAVR